MKFDSHLVSRIFREIILRVSYCVQKAYQNCQEKTISDWFPRQIHIIDRNV